jgi:hypothetical protein
MTWEQFCEHVGISRRWIDEQLADLKPFKMEFLEGFLQFFEVPISKIKYLGEAISGGTPEVEISERGITYRGETIPWGKEHSDDFQALLEQLEEEHKAQLEEKDANLRTKDRLLKDKENVIRKQARDLSKYERSAQEKGLTPEEDAFLQQMENLRTAFDGFYMCDVDPDRREELFRDNDPTPRMTAAYLSTLDYMKKQILAAYDTATDRYGNPAMCPEDAWHPGMGGTLPDGDAQSRQSLHPGGHTPEGRGQ